MDDSKSSVLKRVHRSSAVHEKVWVFRVQKSIREGVKGSKGFDGKGTGLHPVVQRVDGLFTAFFGGVRGQTAVGQDA